MRTTPLSFQIAPAKMSSNLVLLIVLLGASCSVLSFDCSRIMYKESEGVLNYLGNVTFDVPFSTGIAGWNMYFLFHRNFTGIGVWAGTISTNPEIGTAVMQNNATNAQLQQGQEFSFRFRINWSEQTPAKNPPVLQSLMFGDVELCQ